MSSWFQQPMIAYDHSPCSQLALNLFLKLKPSFTKSHIIHVFNSDKNGYMPQNVNTQTIEQQLKGHFSANSKENATIEMREQGSKSVNDVILESFISSGCGLLFLGFVGLKGNKPRAKDLSSRVAQFVYESKISLAIVKKQPQQTNSILFCFDGSQPAITGLHKAVQFCTTYHKSLTVVHCTTPELSTHTRHIKNQIKQLKQQLKFEFVCEEQLGLVDWVKEHQQQFEWVIVTSNGYRGEITKMRFVGSMTSKILEEIDCNLFLLKE